MQKLLKQIFLFSILLLAAPTFAASISLEKILPSGNDLKVGDEVLLDLGLVSGGIEHNAIEGVLKVPPNFSIEKVITGQSFITIWIEDPTNFEKDTITFSGITPAGYNKEIGNVFSVVLRAKSAGAASVEASSVNVFKNDGLGTSISLGPDDLVLRVRGSKEGELPYLISLKDATPPEEFSIELLSNSDLFDGKYAIVWNTRDLASGIAAYDVYEGRRVFKQVVSPYVLENQKLNGKIKVIAYDNAGNTTEALLVPQNRFCIGVDCYRYSTVAIFAVLVLALLLLLWRKLKK